MLFWIVVVAIFPSQHPEFNINLKDNRSNIYINYIPQTAIDLNL